MSRKKKLSGLIFFLQYPYLNKKEGCENFQNDCLESFANTPNCYYRNCIENSEENLYVDMGLEGLLAIFRKASEPDLHLISVINQLT